MARNGLNWSLRPLWLLIFTRALHVAPPSIERENHTRVLQVEVVLDPGSLVAVVQPVSPDRSAQSAYTLLVVPLRYAPPETYRRMRRLLNAGTPMSYES